MKFPKLTRFLLAILQVDFYILEKFVIPLFGDQSFGWKAWRKNSASNRWPRSRKRALKEEYVQDILTHWIFMELAWPSMDRKIWGIWKRMVTNPSSGNSIRQHWGNWCEKEAGLAVIAPRKKIQEMDSSGFYLGNCKICPIPLDRKEAACDLMLLETEFM